MDMEEGGRAPQTREQQMHMLRDGGGGWRGGGEQHGGDRGWPGLRGWDSDLMGACRPCWGPWLPSWQVFDQKSEMLCLLFRKQKAGADKPARDCEPGMAQGGQGSERGWILDEL